MASGEATEKAGGSQGRVQRGVTRLVDASELAMELLELLTGVVLVFLFAVGLYDLVVGIVESIQSGEVFEIPNVVNFLDTVLLLLIIVEVFRTVVAFAREETIVRIIIDASLVAIARKVIGFRPDEYDTASEVFIQASSIAIILLAVIVAFYVVQEVLEVDNPDTPASGTPLVESDSTPGESTPDPGVSDSNADN